MKKSLFFFALMAGMAICNISCSSDSDSSDDTPVVRQQGAATIQYAMPETTAPAAVATTADGNTTEAHINRVNFTEYGKAVIELDIDESTKFATYDVVTTTTDGNTRTSTLKDGMGKVVGTISKVETAASRATTITLVIKLNIEVDGVTFNFDSGETAATETTTPAPDPTTNSGRIVNTWKIDRMKLILDFDDPNKTDASTTSTGGDLKPFLDLAEKNDVKINDKDKKQLDRVIKNLILTMENSNGGLFILKYGDGRSDDAASWSWKSQAGSLEIKITLRNDGGNKFLNDNSKIEIELKNDGTINLMMSTHLTDDNCTASLLVNLS